MTTFKMFLEAAVGQRPTFTALEVEEAVNMLRKHCKDALWMLQEDHAIYRGDGRYSGNFRQIVQQHGFAVVDTSATERASENTSNYYTVILDNTPSRSAFPKRSRSFIASFEEDRAMAYGNLDPKNVMILVPYDGVLIGCVNRDDMWDTRVRLFGDVDSIDSYNNMFEKLGVKAKWESFQNFDKQLKNNDERAIKKFNYVFISMKLLGDGFLEEIDRAYSPKATGHTVHTTKTMPHDTTGEVWVGGKCVVISLEMWNKLRRALRNA